MTNGYRTIKTWKTQIPKIKVLKKILKATTQK